MRKFFYAAIALLFFLSCVGPLSAGSLPESFNFTSKDRVLIIAAHPDDETLGAGGIIQSALSKGAEVRVVFLTHGDLNEISSIFYQKKPLVLQDDFIASGQVRKKEAMSAAKVLGLRPEDITFLGYPDSGTLNIWKKHWGPVKAYRSLISRINKVPYKDDLSYKSYFKGENIQRDFRNILKTYRPTVVFVTSPQDLNPDHRAAYLYLNLALLDLRLADEPRVFCYPTHFRHWPKPKNYRPDLEMNIPAYPDSEGELSWTTFKLSPEELDIKKKALLQYSSQVAYSRDFLLSFARTTEVFAQVPRLKLRGPVVTCGETSLELTKDALRVGIKLDNVVDQLVGLDIDLYCYKHGTDFISAPKLNVRFIANGILVSDRGRLISGSRIQYDFKNKWLILTIPRSFLGDPEALFTCIHTVQDELYSGMGGWRIFEIEKKS